MQTPESKDEKQQAVERPSPARIDTPAEAAGQVLPPKAGSQEAMDEERRTQPSRNRGATDV